MGNEGVLLALAALAGTSLQGVDQLPAQDVVSRDSAGAISPDAPATTPRPFSAEVLFRETEAGVVRVVSGISHGSGFIVDIPRLGGKLIVTNAHVADPGQNLSIVLSDSTRLRAQIIERSGAMDLALLRARLDLCEDCVALPLAAADSLAHLVRPGVEVLAVGFPLSLNKSATSGIVSYPGSRLIMTDVNLNEGNSGGPLIGADGSVLGVNTFLLPSASGPGLSGSVSVSLLHDFIDSIELQDENSGPLPEEYADELAYLTKQPYPIRELVAAGDSVDFLHYVRFGDLETPDFRVFVYTPVSLFSLSAQREREIGQRRRKREEEHALPSADWYTQREDHWEWAADVGEVTRPYVLIRITPKVGETSGSTILGAILGGILRSHYEFKGDLGAVSFYRQRLEGEVSQGGQWLVPELIEPVIGGTRPLRAYTAGRWVSFKDLAYEGAFVFDPAVFMPSLTHRPPSIQIAITDLTNSPQPRVYELPGAVTARIWNDFRPYYRALFGQERLISYPSRFESACGERYTLPGSTDRMAATRAAGEIGYPMAISTKGECKEM